ncbi:MAG: HAMP domain-containing histidine kinase [Candidatus Nomurabacteria bacterium]|nr:MAG: HAMP domain-containing histidine kinase [Candidatus Nomurabacteria bacterium]
METHEVKPDPINKPLMRDYWPKYRNRAYIIITAAQSSAILVIMLTLQLTGAMHLNFYWFFAAALLSSILMNSATLLLAIVLGAPFRDLVYAIVLAAGEPSAETPPNPNKYEYDNDGFREILQTVYEMASQEDAPVKPVETVDTFIKDGLDSTSTGIVILNSDREVVYHNRHAPVRVDTKERDVLDLIFPDHDSLTDWLDNETKNKLTAERTWTRVSDKLPGEKGRRIFDLVVSYHKDNAAETVLTMFERTKEYMPEEDDLDFISFAAHELRGPITVIRGYLDVINEELGPKMEDDQEELMQRLIVASNRLTSYINNILNASRYDRRHLKLHLTEESVRHIYDLISDDMQMRASAQNRILVTDLPESLPTVAADANAIGEVLGNLIDNAIKYSNEGSLVHVTAHAIPGFIEISVIDRGIGMPSNVIQNLFHKFYRSHRSRETVAGTGIGLYICRAIVSSHGGTITARSVENEGATFTFTLPIYDTVADKIKSEANNNKILIDKGGGWIKNHSMYRN